MIAALPLPTSLTPVGYMFNEYLALDLNFASVMSALYLAYYYALEPLAAVSSVHLVTTAHSTLTAVITDSLLTLLSWRYRF